MIFILLPAYNEENSLLALLPKIRDTMVPLGEPYRILVCDDGSTDRTGEILKQFRSELPLDVITHNINRGLGETSRDLFERAAEISDVDDVIVRLDCDDTHEPNVIPLIVAKVREGCDVVIASRFVEGGAQIGVSKYRSFISRCANLFMKLFFPIENLKEYSSGFRGYHAGKIKEAIEFYGNNFIQLKGLGFTCTLEKIVKLKMIGATFSEVPFVLRYDQKRSESKMVSSVTTLGYIVMALLYHWPWGGWRASVRRKSVDWRISNDHS